MGYYPRFPVAIPLWRVGQVRVTHPSAAPYPYIRRYTGRSLDLHVLGAPPAFVLSRDQTLHDILYLLPFIGDLFPWKVFPRLYHCGVRQFFPRGVHCLLPLPLLGRVPAFRRAIFPGRQ